MPTSGGFWRWFPAHTVNYQCDPFLDIIMEKPCTYIVLTEITAMFVRRKRQLEEAKAIVDPNQLFRQIEQEFVQRNDQNRVWYRKALMEQWTCYRFRFNPIWNIYFLYSSRLMFLAWVLLINIDYLNFIQLHFTFSLNFLPVY